MKLMAKAETLKHNKTGLPSHFIYWHISANIRKNSRHIHSLTTTSLQTHNIRHSSFRMDFVTFYINRTERTSRTKVFARSATYTLRIIYNGNLQRIRRRGIRRNHLYGIARTMSCTITAFHSVSQRHAIICHPDGMPYPDGSFLFHCNFAYGRSRTDFGTPYALRTTKTAIIFHLRLHEAF